MIEMLTVVGIIAVLVAVSIPVVNSSLKKAQTATDAANERAAKGAMLMESLLTENAGGAEMCYDNAAGKWTETPPTPYGKCEQHQGYYLKGMISDLGVVEMVWTDGAEKFEQPHSEGYGSTSLAVPTRSYGDFSVQGLDLDNTVTFNNSVLTIKKDTPVTISNKAGVSQTMHRILVTKDVSANITLKNVNIDTSKEAAYTAAFKIADDSTGNVMITLEGTNTLKSGENCAGLQKNGTGTATLTITGTGHLEAIGSGFGAGIGGGGGSGSSNRNRNSGNITILGGTVTAIGGRVAGVSYGGAGIGGGAYGTGNNITISGGTVTATSVTWGAGIGGGQYASGSNIIISGGTVIATGKYGAGIGGGAGSGGSGSNITISGGTVTATSSDKGAGIGGGHFGVGSAIKISGGTVSANGGSGGAGIGGGYQREGRDIKILGGTVESTGGYSSAGIGGGYFGNGSDITISNNSIVIATTVCDRSNNGAGIGGGWQGVGSMITISNSTVTINGQSGAEDIGCGNNKTTTPHTEDANKITVNSSNYKPKTNGTPTYITPTTQIDGSGNIIITP